MKTWLPIKPDYLIENFDSLLQYLSEADYDQKDDFLQETIEKLEEVGKKLLKENFSHKLGVSDVMDEEWQRNLKIVAAAILASTRIKRDVSGMFTALLDTLVVNRMFEDEVYLAKIKDMLLMLANRREIRRLPYTLGDLGAADFNAGLFCNKLTGTTFYESDTPYQISFKDRGLCEFENGEISIVPENPSKINKSRLKNWAEVCFGVVIKSEEKKKIADMDFKDQVFLFNHITQSLSNTAPEPKRVLKSYGAEDQFYVEVVEISNVTGREWVKCRTLDPQYEPLERSLNLPDHIKFNTYVSIARNVFLSQLQPGAKLKVGLTRHNGREYFTIKDTMEAYYLDTDGYSEAHLAIYKKDYKGGTCWLTEVGKFVNIMREDTDDEIHDAEEPEGNKAIEVVYRDVKTHKQGFSIINAERVGAVVPDIDHGEFTKEAHENIIRDMLEYWEVECPKYAHLYIDVRTLTPIYVRTLCHLLAAMGDDPDLPHHERYMAFVAANMLAIMLSDSHDTAYCDFSLSYLRALWAFAQDGGHEWLSDFHTPPEIAHLPVVRKESEIARSLARYKEDGHQIMANLDNSLNVERVENLVDASNTLIGNITVSEISRIKRTICDCLGIESIYKEIAPKEILGDESETLEFKTSVVFPPKRKGLENPDPDPNVQIWAILRTINGFLNTVHGGTLYIGVNNFGISTGVEKDIEWLYGNGRQIFSPDIDHYLQYVKLRADNAFVAYRRSDKDREITSTRVSYTVIKKEDDVTVVRIDVQPYELGCVRLKDLIQLPGGGKIKRPTHVSDAYLREGNTTSPLNDKMREQVEADKRSVIKDTGKQNFISVQEGIESNRYIRLKSYQSYSGEGDRVVEPLELLPLRGLVVGKEKGSKDVRVYKLGRCSGVEVTDEEFKPSAAKQNYSVDPFNMLSASDKKTFKLHLRLDRLAWLLIKEAYPYAEQYLDEEKGDKEYPYSLKCDISDERGVGSFCLSALGHFKVVDTPRLNIFLRDQLANPSW